VEREKLVQHFIIEFYGMANGEMIQFVEIANEFCVVNVITSRAQWVENKTVFEFEWRKFEVCSKEIWKGFRWG
jgi:hypothetical protein